MNTVLVLSGGGIAGIALIKALRALPACRVLVGDCHAENLASYEAHGYFQLPPLADAAAFDAALLALIDAEQIRYLFPATGFELQRLAQLRAGLLSRGAQAWVCDAPLLELAADKRAFYAWLASRQLPVLPWWDEPDADGALPPLIGKPRAGWGGRDQLRVRDAADASRLRGQPDYLWQQALDDFDEYSVDLAVDEHGRCSELLPRLRLRMLGGLCMLAEPQRQPLVEALVQRLLAELRPLGLRGLLNIQLLVQQGQAWISDLNPRVGSSMPLSLAAGLNPLAHLLGDAPSQIAQPLPQRSLRRLEERAIHRPAGLDAARAVVFDLDDTLLDQKRWMADKLALTWQQLRDELPAWDDWSAALWLILEEGERARPFDRWCEQNAAPAALLPRLIEAYRAARPQRAPLYADVLACLAQLRQDGYRLALLSDNPAASQRVKLDASALPPCFDAIVLTADLGRPKPAGDGFAAVAEQLGLPADRLVMVGDHPWRDARGALQAGYLHSFLLSRPGAFFNFGEPALAAWLPEGRCTHLQDGLIELHWYLKAIA